MTTTLTAPSANAVLAPIATETREIAVADLLPNALNPRRLYDEKGVMSEETKRDLEKLGANLLGAGQYYEIRVRPHPSLAGKFELVDGERRWRACVLVGKPTLTCKVGEYTNEHVVAIALSMGGNQVALNAIERADGYKAALAMGMTQVQLAAAAGCDQGRISYHLALTQLPERSRRMVIKGVMSERLAIVIGRVPSRKMREEVERQVAPMEDGTAIMTAEAARALVHHSFSRTLLRAPFDTDADGLVEGVGPCAQCVHRAGNTPSLYEDGTNPHTCMQPSCFAKKAEAARTLLVAAAEEDEEEKGEVGPQRRALTAEENAEVFPAGATEPDAASGFLAYTRPIPADLVKPEVAAVGAPKVCDVVEGVPIYLGTTGAGVSIDLVRIAEMARGMTDPDILKKEVVARLGAPAVAAGAQSKEAALANAAKGSLAAEEVAAKKAREQAAKASGKKKRAVGEMLLRLFDATEPAAPAWSDYELWSLLYEHHIEIIEPADALLVLTALTDEAAPALEEAKSELKTFAAGLGGVGQLRALVLCMIWAPSMQAADKGVEESWVVDIYRTLIQPHEEAGAAKSAAGAKAVESQIAQSEAAEAEDRELEAAMAKLPAAFEAAGIEREADKESTCRMVCRCALVDLEYMHQVDALRAALEKLAKARKKRAKEEAKAAKAGAAEGEGA